MDLIEDRFDQMIVWTWTPPRRFGYRPPEPAQAKPRRLCLGRELAATVIACLRECGPSTSPQIADAVEQAHPGRWTYSTLRRAPADMALGDLILRVGQTNGRMTLYAAQ